MRDEVFVCLFLVRAEDNRPWHKYSARLTRTVRTRAPLMSVFRIPARTYLTYVSSTPVIGPVTRDVLSLLVDLSYWTWRNPHWLKID